MFRTKFVEKIKTRVLYSITFFIFFFENLAVCEIMWENKLRAGQDTDDNIIWHMHITCWITKATDTH
jgi:hypothetical protein